MYIYLVGVAVDHEGDSVQAVLNNAANAIEYASNIDADCGERVYVEERVINSESVRVIWTSEE